MRRCALTLTKWWPVPMPRPDSQTSAHAVPDDARMESTPTGIARSALPIAALVLANLVVLMITSASLAVPQDLEVTSESATPVTDGATSTVLLVLALVLLNGVLLCLSPRTRRIGVGLVIALVAAAPVGFVVGIVTITSFHY
jgi:hypothetical protein